MLWPQCEFVLFEILSNKINNMKKFIKTILIIATVAFTFQSIYGQSKLPEIFLNHLSIVLDSTTYSHLSDSSFISDKLGNIKVKSTTTANDSWSGIYLLGKNSYFEFFSTEGYKGATIGDCGLGAL